MVEQKEFRLEATPDLLKSASIDSECLNTMITRNKSEGVQPGIKSSAVAMKVSRISKAGKSTTGAIRIHGIEH